MKLKKILAGAMAGAMVLGSVVSVSAATETLTGTAWWDGMETGANTALTGDGELCYTITADALVANESGGYDGAFSVELYDATGNYFTTGSDLNAWFGGAAANTGNISGTPDTLGYDLTAGETYTVTVKRESNTFTITYYDGNLNALATLVGVADVTFDDTVNVHVMAQVGTYTVTIPSGKLLISDDDFGLVVGDSKTITSTYVPSSLGTDLTYTSSDEKIATVDSTGKVTAVSEGTAVITAASGDYTDTVTVTVSASANLIAGVTATASSNSLTVGGTATITPAYVATDTTTPTTETTFSYSYAVTSGTDVISVDASTGVVTALKAGSGTVTVTVTCANGTYTSTVDFTVTEATSEAASETASETTSEATSEDDSEEDTEEVSYTTVVKTVELDDITLEGWWSAFTDGLELVDGQQIVITGTTTNNSTNNWNNALFVLYSSDDAAVYASDDEAGTEVNYTEYFVGRLDNYGWGTATYEITSEPDDWDAWLAATQAGAEFTITVTYVDGKIQIVSSCEGAEYVVTYEVEDDSLAYYVALGGEDCTLTDLVATYYEADEESLVETTDDTEDTEDTEDSTTTVTSEVVSGGSSSGADTGDASPIIPIAVAMLGCAAVVVAGKKRMA